MPARVPFQVVYCSGADDGFSATQLEIPNPAAKGWQSPKFCQWPQIIILKLHSITRVRKIQMLSHQYKIATKVDLFVGSVKEGGSGTLKDATFNKLGHIKLSDNTSSNFTSRELKSVHVDAVGQYVKLQFHVNHLNPHNIYNQVGLVAINILGDGAPGGVAIRSQGDVSLSRLADKMLPVTPPALAPLTAKRSSMVDLLTSGRINDENYEEQATPGDDGLDPRVLGLINKPTTVDKTDDMQFSLTQDPRTAERILQLKAEKQRAVEEERYADAGRIKSAIDALIEHGKVLGEMETKKLAAVSREDFDAAQAVKDEIDRMRMQIETQLGLDSLLMQRNQQQQQHQQQPYGKQAQLPSTMQAAMAMGHLPNSVPLPDIPASNSQHQHQHQHHQHSPSKPQQQSPPSPQQQQQQQQPPPRSSWPPIPALRSKPLPDTEHSNAQQQEQQQQQQQQQQQRSSPSQSRPQQQQGQQQPMATTTTPAAPAAAAADRSSSPPLPAVRKRIQEDGFPGDPENAKEDELPSRFRDTPTSPRPGPKPPASRPRKPRPRKPAGSAGRGRKAGTGRGRGGAGKAAVKSRVFGGGGAGARRGGKGGGAARLSEDEPPDMDDTQRSLAGDVIEVFGEGAAKYVMGDKWANKADGVQDVLDGFDDAVAKHGMARVVQALRCVMEQTLRHKVKKVVERGLTLTARLCDALEADADADGSGDAVRALSPIVQLAVPVVLDRTGEVNASAVEEALKLLSRLYALDRSQVAGPVLAPISPTVVWRKGQGRVRAIERLIKDHGLTAGARGKGSKRNALAVGDVMAAVAPALKHAKVEVRGGAIQVVVQCHEADAKQTERLWNLREDKDAGVLKALRQAIAKAKGEAPAKKKKRKKLTGGDDDDDGMTEEEAAEVQRLKQQIKAVKDAQKKLTKEDQGGGAGEEEEEAEEEGEGTGNDAGGKGRQQKGSSGGGEGGKPKGKKGRRKKSVRIANPPVSPT